STVGWMAQSLGDGLDHIQVFLSLDGGLTYGSLVASAGATDTSATWTVPTASTDSARVRVVAFDVDNLSGSDASDANFTIGTAVPIVKFASLASEPLRLSTSNATTRTRAESVLAVGTVHVADVSVAPALATRLPYVRPPSSERKT